MISLSLLRLMALRVDFRYLVVIGFMFLTASLWYMTTWAIVTPLWPIIFATLIQGMGMGLVFTPMNFVAFQTLDVAVRPDGSSLMSLFRNFGSSIGVSAVFTMISRNQQISHAALASNVTATSFPMVDLPAQLDRLPGYGSAVTAFIDAEVSRQALMIAYLNNFYLLTWVLLACVPLPLLLRKPAAAAERLDVHLIE
jgi:DHA2 family multidrug resistance protein